MHINLSQLISPEVLKQQQQQITAEILKAYGVTGNGYDSTGLLDSFGGPGNSAIGTAAIRDIEQMRGWNFTAILAKSLQIAIGNAAVYCPEWIAQAIADQNGEEYKASKRVTGTEQYGVPEGWVTAPLQHRIASLFQSPNEFTDQATFLFQLAEQTDLHGVASILVLPDGRGLPREMWVIPKAAIQPVGPSHKYPEGSYRVGNLSKLSISMASEEQPKSLQQALARLSRREYSARYVIPVGLPSPVFMDDFLNQSSAMADVIDTDTQIHRSRRNMLEKIMTNGPRLEPMEGITIQNDEWNKIIDEFVANNTGPANGGSPWRTPPGVKVINDGQTGRELELAKSADQSRDHTLGMRLMNSSMLGLGSGGSYAQVVGLIKGNTRLVLQPLMRIFSGQITIGLKRFFEEPQNQFMVVLQAASIDDPEQRMKEWGFLKEAGVVKKGEVREAFNMMPFEDEAENEKIAGAQEQPGGAADPFGGFGGGSDASQEYDYGDDYATDSGEPESPGIGMPETSEDRPEMITTGLVKGTEVEQPQLGKLSRREFLRHQKNIFDVLNKLTSGQMNAKAAVLLLETLGLSKQQAQEFVSTVEESKDTVSMAGTETIQETPSAADATGGTASALFARMAQLKAGFGKSLIDDAAKTAATHPDNDLKMPSEKDIKAGLYRKGKVRLCGLQIEIENPVGSIRSGKRPDGTRWAVEMLDHYGYVVGATGYDKDQLDIFVKNGTEPDFDGDVYVINQSDADGEFDEHKCFIGCESKAEAIVRYLDNYSDNWADRIMSVATLSVPEFKVWMLDSIGGPIAGELTPEMAGRYQLVSASAMTIKAVKDPRDGDGDGKLFDGTPQERPAEKKPESQIRWAVNVTPEQFVEAKSKSNKATFLSEINPDDLRNHTFVMSEDATVGAAISADGDIQNVFNNNGPKGAAAEVMIEAIKRGGKTLDCYAGYLPGYYSNFGFVETGRIKFNREYAPDGWDYEKFAEPDVVFMGLPKAFEENEARRNVNQFRTTKQQPEPTETYYEGDQWDQAKSDSRSVGVRNSLGTKSWQADDRSGNPSFIGTDGRNRRNLTTKAISQDTLRQAAQRYQAADNEQPDDPRQQAELIAEILTGLYGDSAIRLIADGDDMEKMASVFKSFTDAITTKAARTRKPRQDPRDADGDGVIFDGTPQERPANRRQPEVAQSQPKQVAQPQQAAQKPTRGKNTPEQVQKIHAAIENALKGERTPKSAKALADQLSTLTVKQLTDLKKKYGISASGKVKKELVDKIAKRLDIGRRTPQVKTPEAKTPEPKKPQTPKPPEAKKPTSLNDDVDAVIKSGDKKAQIAKLRSIEKFAEDVNAKVVQNQSPEVISEANKILKNLKTQRHKLRSSISPDAEQLHQEALELTESQDVETLKVARDKLRESSRRFDMAGDSETSDRVNQKANAINSKIVGTAIDSASKRQRATKTPESAVKIVNEIGEQFKSKVTTALAKLPKAIRDIISDTDVDIQIGSHLTAMRPDLAGVRPRGWADTDTWEMVEACARENVAYVAERHISRYSGEWKDNQRVEGALYHELGHAIDHEIGIKNNTAFVTAYLNDVQTFDTNDKRDMTYFIQQGDAGRSEVAAEGIAILSGAGSGGYVDDEIFKKKFPQSMRVITNMLNKRARTARRA